MKTTSHREQLGSNDTAPAGVLPNPRATDELELLNYLQSLCDRREAAGAEPFIADARVPASTETRH